MVINEKQDWAIRVILKVRDVDLVSQNAKGDIIAKAIVGQGPTKRSVQVNTYSINKRGAIDLLGWHYQLKGGGR